MRLILLTLSVTLLIACSKESEPTTETGLTRDEVMKMAEENIKGNVSDEELEKHGITLGETIEGEDAKEMLIQELEALESAEEGE